MCEHISREKVLQGCLYLPEVAVEQLGAVFMLVYVQCVPSRKVIRHEDGTSASRQARDGSGSEHLREDYIVAEDLRERMAFAERHDGVAGAVDGKYRCAGVAEDGRVFDCSPHVPDGPDLEGLSDTFVDAHDAAFAV